MISRALRSARSNATGCCRGNVAPGDIVLGLAFVGYAFQWLFAGPQDRRAKPGSRWYDPAPFAPRTTLAEALLTPTRIYVQPILPGLKATRDDQGFGAYHRRRLSRQPAARSAEGLGIALDLAAIRCRRSFAGSPIRPSRRNRNAAHFQLRHRHGFDRRAPAPRRSKPSCARPAKSRSALAK